MPGTRAGHPCRATVAAPRGSEGAAERLQVVRPEHEPGSGREVDEVEVDARVRDAARDLTGAIPVEQVAAELAALAEGVLSGTLDVLHRQLDGLLRLAGQEGLAVGDVELYKKVYQPLLMDVVTVPSPDCHLRAPGESWESHSRKMFARMEAALAEHAEETAAVIVEPLVQCAGSMRMYDPVYLRLLREACDRHGVLLIADEIAVGFGRTGTLFACEQAGIRPDFLCLSKGLTGGYLPLSVVLTTEPVYQAFYDDYVKLTAFLHSHSYTGNPIACAAALATLAIFREDDVVERNRALARRIRDALAPLADHPHVAEVRQTGMIAAIEFVKERASGLHYDWRERRGLAAYRTLRTAGSELAATVDSVLARADAVAAKAEGLGQGSERLTGALERLRVSRARLNVLLEAIATGVPVVTTTVGGNPEIVRDGRDGLLVPFGDPAALALAIDRGLRQPWDREDMVAYARSHSWASAARSVLEEFERVLHGDRRELAPAAPGAVP